MMRVWILSLIAGITTASLASAAPPGGEPVAASRHTREHNNAVLKRLPFADSQEFEFAQRGLLAAPESLKLTGPDGRVIWDMDTFGFIGDGIPAPDTVNPSLWRNAQLNMKYGLFQVSERIWQVRGYDVSNITFVAGDTGWIIFDPLLSAEAAAAALDLVTRELGARPVHAVIYSHTHADHYGGVHGVVGLEEVRAGRVQVIAPAGFMEHAISENVTAGNAMSRRVLYQFGPLLPRGPSGSVGFGLGMGLSQGAIGLIPPTRSINKTGEVVTVDGIEMVFQLTPGTEAPAEMNTWFPQFKALWLAENCTATLHNVYTLRGAKVRDARMWAHYIDEALNLYGGEAEFVFQSHHWPRWGNAVLRDYMEKTRDTYRYLHDQTVRMMNQGLSGPEISEQMALPPELASLWFNRDYYGTLRHNVRAVYQFYLGWYDGHPANLNPLPPEPAAKKFVEYMGGSAAALERARRDYEAGNYRWVAQVMKEVVFAEPDNGEARALAASAFEQLAWQAESGVWRSAYLQGASELRHGLPDIQTLNTAQSGILAALTPEMLFDYLAVRLNGTRAAGQHLRLVISFSDSGQDYTLEVRNGVLNHWAGRRGAAAHAMLTVTRPALGALLLGRQTLEQITAEGSAQLEGQGEALGQFLGLLDTYPFWFNIVTP